MKTIKLLFTATGLLWLIFIIVTTIGGVNKSESISLALLNMTPYAMISVAIGLLTFLTTFLGHVWSGYQKAGYYLYAIYGAAGPGIAFFLIDLADSYFTPTGISIGFVGSGLIIGALNGLFSRYLLARFGEQ